MFILKRFFIAGLIIGLSASNIFSSDSKSTKEKSHQTDHQISTLRTKIDRQHENRLSTLKQFSLDFLNFPREIQEAIYEYLAGFVSNKRIRFENTFPIDFALSNCGNYLTTVSYDHINLLNNSAKISPELTELIYFTKTIFSSLKSIGEEIKANVTPEQLKDPVILDQIGKAAVMHWIQQAIPTFMSKVQELFKSIDFKNPETIKTIAIQLVSKYIFVAINNLRVQIHKINTCESVRYNEILVNLNNIAENLWSAINAKSVVSLDKIIAGYKIKRLFPKLIDNLKILHNIAPNFFIENLINIVTDAKALLLNKDLFNNLESNFKNNGQFLVTTLIGTAINLTEQSKVNSDNIPVDTLYSFGALLMNLVKNDKLLKELFFNNLRCMSAISYENRHNLLAIGFSNINYSAKLKEVFKYLENTGGISNSRDFAKKVAQFRPDIQIPQLVHSYFDFAKSTINNLKDQNLDPEIVVINTLNGQIIRKFKLDKHAQALGICQNGVVAALEDSFVFCDILTGQVAKITANREYIRKLTISPCNRYLIASTPEATRIWDIYTGTLLKTCLNSALRLNNVIFSENGRYMVCADGRTLEFSENLGVLVPNSSSTPNDKIFNKLSKTR